MLPPTAAAIVETWEGLSRSPFRIAASVIPSPSRFLRFACYGLRHPILLSEHPPGPRWAGGLAWPIMGSREGEDQERDDDLIRHELERERRWEHAEERRVSRGIGF